jgi:hypothetical protein
MEWRQKGLPLRTDTPTVCRLENESSWGGVRKLRPSPWMENRGLFRSPVEDGYRLARV